MEWIVWQSYIIILPTLRIGILVSLVQVDVEFICV